MIIPDGDRRYAKKQHWSMEKAYQKAAQTAYSITKWILSRPEIEEYTFFSLSYSNVNERSPEELEPIFRAQSSAFWRASRDPFFAENGIRIQASGIKKTLPDYYQKAIRQAETATRQNNRKQFNPLVAYSGEKDIAMAAEKAARKKLVMNPENIREQCMVSSPIDFIIRTANEKRISDAPLFCIRYAEFCSIAPLFPETTALDIEKALEEYHKRKRTFGK